MAHASQAKESTQSAKKNAEAKRAPQSKGPAGETLGPLSLQAALADPLSASAEQVLQLQRQYGNRAAQRLIQGALADKIQRDPAVGLEGGLLDGDLQNKIHSAQGGGQPLDKTVGARVGQALGADFSSVRVHADSQADTLNRSLSAKAFTLGSDVFFSQGAYDPGTHNGQKLLAHELTHVVQQGGGANKVQTKLTVSPAGDQYEQEADRVAEQVLTRPGPQVSPVQRTGKEEEEVQTKLLRHQPVGAAGAASADVEAAIDNARDGGQPLAASLQHSLGQAPGADYEGVRVHPNARPDTLNRALQARAFTAGSDVFFRRGEYYPASRRGQELVTHELTHTWQQGAALVQRHGDGHQSGCGCAACKTGIQRQATEELQLNRIQRKQADHAAACHCAACGGIQRQAVAQVQRTLEGAPTKATRPAVSGAALSRVEPRVQRHSSWEHKALGDITPEDLNILGAARNLTPGSRNLNDVATGTSLTATTNEAGQTNVATQDNVTIQMTDKNNRQAQVPIKREDVLHVIEQEIRRLNHFKNMAQFTKNAKSAKDVEKRLQQREKKTLINEAVEAAEASGGTVEEASQAAADSPEWGVKIISIGPLKDGTTEYITSGEMNTLADIYGSVDEMMQADPKNLHGIILGVRQQSLFRFMELYEEVSDTKKYQEQAAAKKKEKSSVLNKIGSGLKMAGRGILGVLGAGVGAVGGALGGAGVGAVTGGKLGYLKGGGGLKGAALGALGGLGGLIGGAVAGTVGGAVAGAAAGATGMGRLTSLEDVGKYSGLGFKGAIGNTGVGGASPGNMLGELRFMGMIPGHAGKSLVKRDGEKDETTSYEAGLARNACHFPPDSWNAWQRYHNQAVVKARESYRVTQGQPGNALPIANEALMLNGFGDHFLQDSYAAGHLIDKTKIMKFYVQWIDKEGKSNFRSDKEWRRIQNIAYGQKDFAGGDERYSETNTAARDPQMVENQGGSEEKRHDQLGLKAASLSLNAQLLLQWWANDVFKKSRIRNPREKKVQTLLAESPLKAFKPLQDALQDLYAHGIVRVGAYDTKQRGAASVKVKPNGTVVLREDYVPTTKKARDKLQTNPAKAIEKMSKKANWQDYNAFIKSALLQKSTNALHDYFCEKGLDVVTGDGLAYRVYGDDAMLQKNSSAGVKHSAETTRMSRDAIESAVATGEPAHSTAEIKNRFPKKVVGENGLAVTLDQWHNDGILKNVCQDTVFPDMRKKTNYLIQVGAMGIKDVVMGGFKGIHKPDDAEKPHGAEVF